MGIATDLSRVKSNITAALAAIAEKGVTVPDGSNSDTLAELIASIQAGGTVITGTVTLNGSWTSYKLLTYDELIQIFGEPLPTLLVLFYHNVKNSSQHTDLVLWKSDESNARYCYKSSASGTNFGNYSDVSTTIPTLNENGLAINRYSTYYFQSGEYRYCIARFE